MFASGEGVKISTLACTADELFGLVPKTEIASAPAGVRLPAGAPVALAAFPLTSFRLRKKSSTFTRAQVRSVE